jgi:hypothetical protein
MVRTRTLVLAGAGGLAAAASAWTLYQRYTTETVPYTVVARLDDVELRRYPSAVRVETVADSENAAFGRLFRYISGANETDTDVSMTAPVEVSRQDPASPRASPVPAAPGRRVPGRRVPMTTPVETVQTDGEVRMVFYLPADFDVETAPEPTDETVELVAVPERTLAVRRFSGRATDERVDSETDDLLATLDRSGVDTSGDPFFMGYDAPWTVPFLRRNEVAIEVDTS